MTLVVTGQPTIAWCGREAMQAFGGAWEEKGENTVVCQSPGIYVADSQVKFVLPRCYSSAQLDETSSLRAVTTLLKALSRYRLQGKAKAVVNATGRVALREVGDIGNALEWLEAALSLAEDERLHGQLYVASSEVSPRRQGRVHWAKTQRHSFHIVDGTESTVSPLWRSRLCIDPQAPITRLHRDTCSSIRSSLGQGKHAHTPWRRDEAISLLDYYDYKLFADRPRRVARWLRQYWTRTSGSPEKQTVNISALWSPAFEYVWERMLREVMAGRRLAMPHGKYKLGATSQPGYTLVPDFAVHTSDRCLIVDAKHYSLDELPDAASLTKQFLYRWFASRESGYGTFNFDNIVSVFVLPAVGRAAVADVLGAHELDPSKPNQPEHLGLGRTFGTIWVMTADFETAANAYTDQRRVPDFAHSVLECASSTGTLKQVGGRHS